MHDCDCCYSPKPQEDGLYRLTHGSEPIVAHDWTCANCDDEFRDIYEHAERNKR